MDSKPGWKTSEAWLTGVVAWLMQDVMVATDDWRVMSVAAFSAAMVCGFYIWSRTQVKGTEDQADAS